MKKMTGLLLVVMFVLLALVCSKHERNNVFDTGGSNWRPPVVSAMDDTTVSMLDTVVLHATVTDSNTTITSFIWQGIDMSFLDTTSMPACEFFPLSSKHLRVAVKAVDNNGISSNWDTVVLDVHSYIPTIKAMADTTVAIFDSVRFHAHAFDTGGFITRYVWNIPACRISDTTTGGFMASRFDTNGTFAAIVYAVDKKGLNSPADTFAVSVHTYMPRISVADSFLTTGAGNTVHLAASATDSNGTIAGYAWSFDGSIYVRTAASTYDTSFSATGMKVVLVKAIDDDSLFSRADTIRIAIKGNKPLLYAPINRAVTNNLKVALTWMPGYYNHQYLIQFDTTIKFSFSIFRTDTFLDVSSSLKFGTEYYWRVIGVSATGASDTSDTWNFTTPAMLRIQLLAPADNTTLTVSSATLSWQPGYLRSHFQILVDTVNPPARTVIASQADTFYASGTLAYEKKYYWRVVASDLSGTKDSSSVRSFTTPAAPVTPTGGLVAYYPFNGNANDSSGNGYNATVNGATLTTDRFGYANSAYLFDSNSYIQPGFNSIRTDSNFTVSVWYKGHPDVSGYIVGQYSGTPGTSAFWINFINYGNNNLPSIQAVCGTNAGLSTILVSQHDTSSWHHAAIVFNRAANVFHLYSDNVDTFITLSSPIVYSNSVPFRIGMTSDANHRSLKGKIDDVRFYSQALSSAEIAALFHANGWTGSTSLLPPALSSDSASMTAAATAGAIYKDTVHATDPQGQALTYSVLSGPTGIAMTDSILSWTPAAGDVGSHNVKVLVRNAAALGDTLSWIITVGRADGLVAYFPFTGNANDSSGNGYNAVVNGATLTTDRKGIPNSAYFFSGAANMPTTVPANSFATYSVSAWVNPNEISTAGNPFGIFTNDDNVAYGHSLALEQGRPTVWVVNNATRGSFFSTTILPLNVWSHVVLLVSNGSPAFYVNGTQTATGTSGNVTTVPISVGNATYGIGYTWNNQSGSVFPGGIDDIRLYSRLLSASEITALYRDGGWNGYPPVFTQDSTSMTATAVAGVIYKDTVHATNPNGRRIIFSVLSGPTGLAISDSIISWTPAGNDLGSHSVKIKAADTLGLCDTLSWMITVSRADGLVAYYPFTGNANDSSGNGNNGTVNGATLTTDRFGNANKAYQFSGSAGCFVQTSSSANFPKADCISMTAWVHGTGTSNDIVRLAGTTNDGVEFGTSTTGTATANFTTKTGTFSSMISAKQINDGDWHFVAFIVSGKKGVLTMDNIQIDSIIATDTFTMTSPGYLTIGKNPVSSTPYTGSIDDIRVYNCVLTSLQIDSLYHLGGWIGTGSTATGKAVFLSDRSGSQQLWRINLNGIGLTQLTSGSPTTKFWPKWSPDGTKIVYCGCVCNPGQGFGAQIYILDTNGNQLQTVTTAAPLVGVAGLGWSNDGGSILYIENISCGQRVRKASLTGSTDSIMYVESGTTQNQPDDNPLGNGKILYCSAPCAGYTNIKLYDGNFLQSTNLTPYDLLYEFEPRWSRDGQKIVFAEDSSANSNWGNSLRICLMNNDGSNRTKILSCNGREPVFAPGDSKIVFMRYTNDDIASGKSNIWIMDLNGNNLYQLSSGDFVETNPDVH